MINAAAKVINDCTSAITIIGSMYPFVKSALFIGVAKSLIRKDPLLSFAIVIAVKSITKVCPNMIIPPIRLSILNIVIPASFGIDEFTSVITISITIGNAMQNI